MLRVFFTLLLALTCLSRAHAVGIWDGTHRADLICVATFDSMEPVESQPPITLGGAPVDPLTIYAVKMNVSEVWKGVWADPHVTLHFGRREMGGPFVYPSLFEKNQNYLIAAKRGPNGRFFQSPDDLNGKTSFFNSILIRDPVAAEPNQPVMVRVTRQLIANLLDPDVKIKRTGLGMLGGYEDVFTDGQRWVKNQFPADEVSATKSLVEKQAIPEILRLTRDDDEEMRTSALETASWLQQTAVIPRGKPYADSMAWGLFHFHNREALPLLMAQLSNTNPMARIAIIEAFEQSRDPIVIPDLKRLLTDPDTGVRERAQYALKLIGG